MKSMPWWMDALMAVVLVLSCVFLSKIATAQQPTVDVNATCASVPCNVNVHVIPPAVDCVTTALALAPEDAGPWSVCTAAGMQTRTEVWRRLVLTPASGDGLACAPLLDALIGSQGCTPPPPPVPPLSALPLVQPPNLKEIGGFAFPAGTFAGTTFEYGGNAIVFDVKRQGLFIASHDYQQYYAETTIPALKAAAPYNVGTFLQPFTDVIEGRIPLINPGDPNGNKFGGAWLSADGSRLCTAWYAFYDGQGTQKLSHFCSGSDLSVTGDVVGPLAVGSLGAGFVSGYMGVVPMAWRAALGGSAFTGNCCLSIISRTSYGPAVSVFEPADLGVKSVVPATPLLYYTGANPLAQWDATSTLFNGATHVRGVVLPEGTRSVLFFGRQGTGKYCYGQGGAFGTTCIDPEDTDKGTHAYPYQYQVWAYDALDLAAVKVGTKQPWQVQPYATWTLPWRSGRQTDIRGVAYDPATGRIFVSQAFGDSDRPVVHVFTVQGL